MTQSQALLPSCWNISLEVVSSSTSPKLNCTRRHTWYWEWKKISQTVIATTIQEKSTCWSVFECKQASAVSWTENSRRREPSRLLIIRFPAHERRTWPLDIKKMSNAYNWWSSTLICRENVKACMHIFIQCLNRQIRCQIGCTLWFNDLIYKTRAKSSRK